MTRCRHFNSTHESHVISREMSTKEVAFVKNHLEKELEGVTLIACYESLIQIRFKRTDYRQLVLCIQFSKDYPDSVLLLEAKSKTISDELLAGIVKVTEEHLQKFRGQPQVVAAARFVRNFIWDNRFVVCSEELSFIKKELICDEDTLKVKQKLGVLHIKAIKNKYHLDCKLTIPDDYPVKPVSFVVTSNFPVDLEKVFVGQATEIARQCVEPPIVKKKTQQDFVPQPSLKRVAVHLVKECLRRFPSEKCPCCQKSVLPEDPSTKLSSSLSIELVYCGHLYHHGCLDRLMTSPPFGENKKCPACGKRIFHDKWNISAKLMEERWAHQEARKREVDEVADFLGL